MPRFSSGAVWGEGGWRFTLSRPKDVCPAGMGCLQAGIGQAVSVPACVVAGTGACGAFPSRWWFGPLWIRGGTCPSAQTGCSEAAGGLSGELRFWQVSRELGSDLGHTAVFPVSGCAQGQCKAVSRSLGWSDAVGHCDSAQKGSWECVKWDLNEPSGVFCTFLLLLNDILQSP